ncbi:hypothetical protein Vau01_053100 [Virgisporangium aurantiacum]|uniref:Right handed beta helix domain-containing protein n=2 Tax=Virgisporangium aurantiacum TaxID=175570 RepID=A0A8J3Z5N1_9ACTN|nr:hypothetical protein Vau01_053100 [Virgisporangium aurantiacum]
MFNGGFRGRVRVMVVGTVLIGIAGVAPAGAEAASTTVRTKDELIAALGAAAAGDTVFVDGSVSINLTGTKAIRIPAGVTLASNRGENGALGALLYNDELDLGQSETWAQFVTTGSGARVTGLRLRGPDREIRDSAYQYDNSDGIKATDASDLLVDNNELYGWSHAAVSLTNSIEGLVRNNNIHHNRRTGLGYGVVLVNDASALVENNTFTQNRHAIAASGIRNQRYEARYNVVVDNAVGHSFDMHGENEALDDGSPYAGDVMHIKHNSFRSTAYPGFVVRGRPFTGAYVAGNCFAHSGSSAAVQQKNFTGNLSIGSNTYGTTTGSCHTSGRKVGWRMSSGGTATYAPLAGYTYDASEVGFGDFDGDGKTDVFRATGYRWYYSSGGTGRWVPGALSGLRLSQVRFGDFDDVPGTDVFTVSGDQWQFSSGGTGAWQPLATSSLPLESLRLADFDGDGRTDVFSMSGNQWRYSSGGRSGWANLNSAAVPLADLRFGDFDGDAKADIFSTTGSQWRFSSGGVGVWSPLATSGAAIGSLRFGDFDGDGKTDVFQTTGGQWQFSSAGRTSWTNLTRSACPLSALHVGGDFDGDGRADIFDGRCGE